MPKEAPGALPLPRSQHRGPLPQFRPQATHQPPASYHHVQQYLARPPGYQFYPTPAAFGSGQNDPPTSSAPTSQSSAQANYEAALKMASKFDRGALGAAYASFKVASYDQRSSSPASSPQTSVASHKPSSFDRPSNALAGYRSSQPMSGSPYDPKMSLYASTLPYDRFSKKKLAAHVSEKSSSPYVRNDKKPSRPASYASSSYDRPAKPAPTESDKAAGRSYYERRSQRQEAERQMDAYETQSPSPYDRTPSAAPAFDRITTAPTTPYDRLTSTAAYERRAVFDRAYEVAAYDRRLYTLASGLGGSYYAQFANRERTEEYEAKEPATYPAKPRMSLLTSAEYLSSLSRRTQQSDDGARSGHPSVIVPPSRSPADSSPRKTGKNETLPPLTIDTSSSPKADADKPSIYMPTVEPISPTSPPDQSGEDGADAAGTGAPKSSAKDTLLIEIARVDREINKIDHLIGNLKRKQSELEQKAKKSETESSEETSEAPLPQHFSLSHKIYSENRRKAKENNAAFSHLGPPVDLPLYNQPSDTPVYEENRVRHLLFKGRLIAHLRRRRRDRFRQEKEMTADYALRTENWNRLVEKMENSPERKRREVENRELFEKTFPKIRKEREDRERFLRVGSRVKSDADLEEIMDNLHEQEMEVKKMRDYAAVPPLLLTAESRRCVYVNTNGRIEDFPAEYKERRHFNIWTDAEKDIFREKYIIYPKNFGAIASFLERKSVSDCVQHYYLSKKTENYKRLLKKSGQKSKSGRNRNKTAAPPPLALDPGPFPTPPGPAIAPRFQRDYKPASEVTASKAEPPQFKTEVVPPVKAEMPDEVAAEGPTLAPPLTPPAEPAPFVPAAAVPPANVPVSVSSPTPEAAPPQAQTQPHQAPQPQPQPQQQHQQLHQQLQHPQQHQQPHQQPMPHLQPHQQHLLQSHQQFQRQPQQFQQQPVVHKPPPPLKPLMLPHLPDIPIVVIDDSDDSNSGSHFPYARK